MKKEGTGVMWATSGALPAVAGATRLGRKSGAGASARGSFFLAPARGRSAGGGSRGAAACRFALWCRRCPYRCRGKRKAQAALRRRDIHCVSHLGQVCVSWDVPSRFCKDANTSAWKRFLAYSMFTQTIRRHAATQVRVYAVFISASLESVTVLCLPA